MEKDISNGRLVYRFGIGENNAPHKQITTTRTDESESDL